MYTMFEKEFRELPPQYQEALRKELETVIRAISSKYGYYQRDYSQKPLTGDEINAKIKAVFDLVRNLSPRTQIRYEQD